MATSPTQTITAFFEYLFGNDEGYAAIATTRPPAKRDTFKEQFFAWPDEKDKMADYIENAIAGNNVYFCVNLFEVPRRKKDNAIPQNLVWADLDLCRPEDVEIPPQCVIESSPNKFQAIWRLDRKIDPKLAENYSKRIAYSHPDIDKSGHDLTQLLRVPGSYNFKYELAVAPRVELLSYLDDLLPTEVFESLPQPTNEDVALTVNLPVLGDLPTPEMVVHRYRESLESTAFVRYYTQEPAEDWSGTMWALLSLCMTVGMDDEETFVIARNANCNKYRRDGRPETELWKEVQKKRIDYESDLTLFQPKASLEMPQLLTAEELASLPRTLIDDYTEWGKSITDAPPAYHELTCAVMMSAVMATTIRLHTSNSKVIPNLWGMILGDSSLTRKTTAMELGVNILLDVNDSLLVASDASPEGLMHTLSLRPKMVSMFYRDEVAGLFDAMKRKDYMASLPEILTKMYDVPKYWKRKLRKEDFVVSEPIFIMLCGGTPERMYGLIDEDYYTTGFMPRFLMVRGHSDALNVRPTGPPLQAGIDNRQELLQTFSALHSMYTDQTVIMDMGDGQKLHMIPEFDAMVDPAVWLRTAEMERMLMDVAANSAESERALPTFSRLFVSLLKMTMLIAAARQEPKDLKFRIELDDLLCAASYMQKWGEFMVELLQKSGQSSDETKLQSVYRTISQHPGIHRSELLAWHKLYAKELNIIEETLIQRLMIQTQRKGRGVAYWPIGR